MVIIMIEKKHNNNVYIWNGLATILNSFQSAIIMMIIAQITGNYDAGIFVIAYAMANLAMMVGKYGMRQFQVSDIAPKYSFKTYSYSRIITIVLMFFFTAFYLVINSYIKQYSVEKVCIISLWCFLRMVESYEDVYHAELQKLNLLGLAGKIISIRIIGMLILFFISYAKSQNLLFSTILSILFNVLIAIVFNYKVKQKYSLSAKGKFEIDKTIGLLKECFSLFISSFLFMYMTNAPKYCIDGVLIEDKQAVFSYIYMPVFIINLFSNFIYQPMLVKYAILWNDKKFNQITRIIIKQILCIAGITIFFILGFKVIGLFLLGVIYSTNLMEYSNELLVLLVAGGFLALVNYFQMILTIMRNQKTIFLSYLIVSCIFILLSTTVLIRSGMIGLCIFFMISLFGISIIMGGKIIYIIYNGMNADKGEMI